MQAQFNNPAKNPAKKPDFDILLIGGGLIGLTAAIGFASLGLKSLIIDREDPEKGLKDDFDGRSSALAHSSVLMLKALNIWPHLAAYSAPIQKIQVSDGPIGKPSLLHLHFDHQILGTDPLGFMLENRHTRLGLDQAIKDLIETGMVTRLAPVHLRRADHTKDGTSITLADGRQFSGALLIGADGRQSQIRQIAQIPTTHIPYHQHGIVCSIAHAVPHDFIAHERFLPSGPFAILPLLQDPETGKWRSSLVWTEKSNLTPALMALGPDAFEAEIQRRIGGFLGAISVIGARFSYPLGLSFCHALTADRLALIGDAAHLIHPIAGQGLNLGLRDVAALLNVIADRKRLGLPFYDQEALDHYARWRRTDSASLMLVTDSLNRLFSNNIFPVAPIRRLGLALVDKITPLKKQLMNHARGSAGNIPRLLKGEIL